MNHQKQKIATQKADHLIETVLMKKLDETIQFKFKDLVLALYKKSDLTDDSNLDHVRALMQSANCNSASKCPETEKILKHLGNVVVC